MISTRLARNDSTLKTVLAIILFGWFTLVFGLGATGAFVTPPGSAPLPIALGVTVPILLFLVAFATLRRFRDAVLHVDLALATSLHAWRFAGLGFLALYANRILPGFFAWPAGLGDILIGLTAPWVAFALVRRPSFAGSPAFVLWNLLGLADLLIAVVTGAIGARLATGLPGEVTTAPMGRLPLVLIPAYFVPLLIGLHVVALVRARRWVRQARLELETDTVEIERVAV